MAFSPIKKSIVRKMISVLDFPERSLSDSLTISLVCHFECMQPIDRFFAYIFMCICIAARHVGFSLSHVMHIPFISPFLGLVEMHIRALNYE